MFAHFGGFGSLTFFGQPAGQQMHGVIPEGIDLHCFAAARRDNPVANLRIHPSELIAGLALAQQAVAGIDVDAESRAAQMMAMISRSVGISCRSVLRSPVTCR